MTATLSSFRRPLLVFALFVVSAALAAIGLLGNIGTPRAASYSVYAKVALIQSNRNLTQVVPDDGVAAPNLEQFLQPLNVPPQVVKQSSTLGGSRTAEWSGDFTAPSYPSLVTVARPRVVGLSTIGYKLSGEGPAAVTNNFAAKHIETYAGKPGALAAVRFPMRQADLPPNPADPCVLQVWAGLGGHRQGLGCFVPVIARIHGGQEPFRGVAQVRSGETTWAAQVQLIPGEDKTVELEPDVLPDPDGVDTPIEWSLISDTGREVASQRIKIDSSSRPGAYIISDAMVSTCGLDPVVWVQDVGRIPRAGADANPPFTIPVLPSKLAPTNVLGWSAARVVVLDPAVRLSKTAARALEDWVRTGGVLITDSRPEQCAGLCIPGEQVGAGYLVKRTFAVRPDEPPSRTDWAFWVLAAVAPSTAPTSLDLYRLAAAPSLPAPVVAPLAASPPALYFPTWPALVLMGLGYAAVFGPFSLWMMKRTRRIVHVWLVVPVLALLFTGCVFFWGRHLRRTMRTANVNTVITTFPGSTRGMEDTEMMLFRPDPGDFHVPLASLELFQGSAGSGTVSDRQYGGFHTGVLADSPGYEPDSLSAEGMVDLGGSVSFTVLPDGRVTLVNHTQQPLGPGLIRVGSSDYRRTPFVSPGETVQLPRHGWIVASKAPAVSPTDDDAIQAAIPEPNLNARWVIPGFGVPDAWDLVAPGQQSSLLCVVGTAPDLRLQTSRS